MKQVFASGPCALESRIMLDEKQAHHLFDVLRTGPRETVRVVCDGEVWLGHVEEKPFVWLFGKEETQKQGPEITLCTALIKSDKFEWMLQKAAELGVTRIVPFVSRYSVIQLDDKRALRKMERWNQILVNACRQCNRHDLVELAPVSRLEDLAAYKSQLNLVAYEKEPPPGPLSAAGSCIRHMLHRSGRRFFPAGSRLAHGSRVCPLHPGKPDPPGGDRGIVCTGVL